MNFDLADGYMVDSVTAGSASTGTPAMPVTKTANGYVMSTTTRDNSGNYINEIWIFFSHKRIPTDDYVVEVQCTGEHFSSISCLTKTVNQPGNTTLFYVPKSQSTATISVYLKDGCYLTKRTVDGSETSLSGSPRLDDYILYFDSTKYGDSNKYVVKYDSHNTADDVYYTITVQGLEHTTATVDSAVLSETALGDTMVSTFKVISGGTKRISFAPDTGYRITQVPAILSGTAVKTTGLSTNGSSSWIELSNISSDITVQCYAQAIPKYSITVNYAPEMTINSSAGTMSTPTGTTTKTVIITNIVESSNVNITVTYDDDFNYSVSGTVSGYSESNGVISITGVASNLTITITEKPNDECTVHVYGTINQIAGVSFDDVSASGTQTALVLTEYSTNVTGITSTTRLKITPTFNSGYAVSSVGVVDTLDDETATDYSSYLSKQDGYYLLSFPEDNGEYIGDLYITFICESVVADNYYVKVNITPGHISQISASSSISEQTSYDDPTDSVIVFAFDSSDTIAFISYTVDTDNATYQEVTGDEAISTGVVGSTAVQFNTSKTGSSNPYEITIVTVATSNTITLTGLKNLSTALYYDSNSLSNKIITPVNESYTIELNKQYSSLKLSFVLSEGYKIYNVSSNVETVTFEYSGSDVGGSYDSDTGKYTSIFHIRNISSDTTIALSIYKIPTWKNATWYQLAKYLGISSNWSTDSDGKYVYSTSVSSSSTKTYSLCVGFVYGADYKIVFGSSTPSTIIVRLSTELNSKTDSGSSSSYTYIKLDSSGYELDGSTFIIRAEDICSDSSNGYKYMYIYFTGFSATSSSKITPTIDGIYYSENEVDDLSTSSTDTSSINAYFSDKEITEVQIINEVDITGDAVPFSSYSIKVIDQNNTFNPMLSQTTLKKGQLFEIYSLVCDYTLDPDAIFEILNPTYYITKIATARLNQISSEPFSAVLSFIGPLEYYSEKYLDANELLLSSAITKTNTKQYLQSIFGTDVDVSNFDDNDTIITPFKTESKTEIARIIAQAKAMYLDETNEGKIRFRSIVDNTFAKEWGNDEFKLKFIFQKQMPTFTKVSDTVDSIQVAVHKKNIESSETLDLDDLDLEIYAKYIPNNLEGSEIDNGSNLNGYILKATCVDGSTSYYDDDGNKRNITDTYAAIKGKNLKYVRIRVLFPKKIDTNSAIFHGTDFSSDGFFSNCESQSLEDLKHNYNRFNPDTSGNGSVSGVYLTEDFIDFWSIYSPGNHFLYLGTSAAAKVNYTKTVDGVVQEDLNEFASDLILGIMFIVNSIAACPIKEDDASYNYLPCGTANNQIQIDNPLITTGSQAQILAAYQYIIHNRYLYQNSSVWRGNCTIACSDSVLVPMQVGINQNRVCENYFKGIVVRNDINYNGGLSETTVVAIAENKLYESTSYPDNVLTALHSSSDTSSYQSIIGKEL